MTYKEFKNLAIPLKITNYKHLNEYLDKRYANYLLLYEVDEFADLFDALVLEYQNVIQDIETAIETRKDNNVYKFGNFGEQTISYGTDKYVHEKNNRENYAGYQVVGTFKIDNEDSTDTKTSNGDVMKNDTLGTLRALENDANKLAWSKFNKEFERLFITVFSIV